MINAGSYPYDTETENCQKPDFVSGVSLSTIRVLISSHEK